MRGRHARPPGARRSLQPSMLATGVLAALATTGGVVTVVGWTADSTSETFTVRAAAIPRIDPPRIRAATQPRISWRPVRIADEVPVQRYVVTRHLGEVAQVACDIPATARPRCVDRYAPAGYRATYTVAARHGAHWTGVDSAPSAAVATPGVAVPISVNGVLLVPGADGAPVVAGGAPPAAGRSASPGAVATAPGGAPGGPPAPSGAVDEPPVVHVPPAPPGPDGGKATPAPSAVAGPSGEPVPESATTPAQREPVIEAPAAVTAD